MHNSAVEFIHLCYTDLEGYPELDLLSHALSFSSPSLRVSTRIEAYSCKAIKSEKRLFKTLEHDLVSDLTLSTSISPPEHHIALVESAFGPLDKRESRKTLWLLIATLNLAFPDHDFSRVSADEFMKEESARSILTSLSSALSHLRTSGSDPSYYRSFSSYPPPTASTLPAFTNSNGRGGVGKGAKGHNLTTSALQNKLRALQGEDEIPTHPFLRQVLDPVIDLGDCEVFSYTPDIDSDPHAYQSDDEEDYTSNEDMDDDDDCEGSGKASSSVQMDDEFGWSMDGVTPSTPSTPASASAGSSVVRRGHRRRRSSLSRRALFAQSFDSGTGAFSLNDGLEASPSGNGSASTVAVAGMRGDGEGSIGDETGGLLWSSNYFFYNRKMRRVLFISCWGRKLGQTALNPHAEKIAIPKSLQRPWMMGSTTGSKVVTRLMGGEKENMGGSAPASMLSFGQNISHECDDRARSVEQDRNISPLIRDTRRITPIASRLASPSGIASPRLRSAASQSSRPYKHKRRASSAGNSVGRSGRRSKSARKGT